VEGKRTSLLLGVTIAQLGSRDLECALITHRSEAAAGVTGIQVDKPGEKRLFKDDRETSGKIRAVARFSCEIDTPNEWVLVSNM
jgi:hypothetical protein